MSISYKTPGVYIEELSKLPPSVAEVETAIPAFIGYTQLQGNSGNGIKSVTVGPSYAPLNVTVEVARITSLQEYEQIFGKAAPVYLTVSVRDTMNENTVQKRSVAASVDTLPVHTMYYHMQLYFANGGGPCYIVSVGKENGTIAPAALQVGLDTIKSYDEPTLLLLPEAVNIINSAIFNAAATYTNTGNSIQAVTMAVNVAQDDVDAAQAAIDAVYPATPSQFLLDALNDAQGILDAKQALLNGLLSDYDTARSGLADAIETYGGADMYDLYDAALQQCAALKDRFVIMDCYNDDAASLRDGNKGIGMNNLKYGAAYHPFLLSSVNYEYNDTTVTIDYRQDTNGNGRFSHVSWFGANNRLNEIQSSVITDRDAIYNLAKQAVSELHITLNPSAAMAGIYAAVDSARGVWKAPANVGVSMVNGLTKNISGQEQEGLNVDPNAGKSINAIRFFTGKGNLVWGARTLAGNDNEWRYINVRRLFNMVEESTKKATEAFVFEANDANTWVKVQGMIENYLTTLWRAGALQGAKPEHAFYVSVGLGKTMTAQDILEGRMYVEIGMAAVRPAEFIILRFSHKLAES